VGPGRRNLGPEGGVGEGDALGGILGPCPICSLSLSLSLLFFGGTVRASCLQSRHSAT
jgi:hypothetical protein